MAQKRSGWNRRDFLKTCAAAAPALAVSSWPGGASAQREAARNAGRQALGFPVPALGVRGDSSIGAAIRAMAPRSMAAGGGPSVSGVQGALAGLIPPFDRDRGERPIREPRVVPPVPLPSSVGEALRARHRDLRRHFILEYYPWYCANPWSHWDQWDRQPPVDVGATSMPMLGPYDSLNVAVVEQHARWIAASGIGAINLSWWGPGSDTDRATPLVMDIMAAHDIRVTFHIEPYRDDRAGFYAQDVRYLLREYGEKRRWDTFLLLEHADLSVGPVLKSFRTILPAQVTDCQGVTHAVPDYTPDAVWREQVTALRADFASQFRLTLLADTLDRPRTVAAGFDGIAIYDNFVAPSFWPEVAAHFSNANLVFSFNTNAGYDQIEPRGPQGPCYQPLPFAPPVGPINWNDPVSRLRAQTAGELRIGESFGLTTALQIDPQLTNWRRGFFLVYVNSFNEWHEGTQFEPAKHFADLSPAERLVGYHNPTNGLRRMQVLQELLDSVYRG